MLNRDAKLVENIFAHDIAQAATRDGFGKGVVEAGKNDANIVVLCADLKESTRAEEFEKVFPERFIEMGVAEAAMATVAAGMAEAGKISFIASYAAFNPGRNYEQIRTTIALNEMPVKIMGMHAGVSVGPDGATHQMLEDLALMRVLPNMVVLNPGDAEEARKAVVWSAKHVGPVYIRFGRAATPLFTTTDSPFLMGKALGLWRSEKPRIALLSTGALSYTALLAARSLDADGIGSIVLHNPSVKPLDEVAIIAAAGAAGLVVTIEEHQIAAGFGSAVAELLSEKHPVPITRLGINDQFGQSGTPAELLEHYKLSPAAIAERARQMLAAR
ncbi:MAG: transketolase family protein [Minisyncoccia bacterium]